MIGIRNSRGPHWRGEGGSRARTCGQISSRRSTTSLRLSLHGDRLENIAASYNHEAGLHDSEANVRKRLCR